MQVTVSLPATARHVAQLAYTSYPPSDKRASEIVVTGCTATVRARWLMVRHTSTILSIDCSKSISLPFRSSSGRNTAAALSALGIAI